MFILSIASNLSSIPFIRTGRGSTRVVPGPRVRMKVEINASHMLRYVFDFPMPV
jgi:hypothetical protein